MSFVFIETYDDRVIAKLEALAEMRVAIRNGDTYSTEALIQLLEAYSRDLRHLIVGK